MATGILTSFERILTELAELQKPGAFEGLPKSFPSLLATGTDGSILVNANIDREIRVVADWLLEHRPSAKKQHTLKEWRTAVRNAVGPSLLRIDLDTPVADQARELKKHVVAALDGAPRTIQSLLTSMGCSLLAEPLGAPLAIGPVLFESKTEWLARAERIGQVNGRMRKRLERSFSGHRLVKSRNARQRWVERAFLDVLLRPQLVCTVETQQLAFDLSQSRAIIGARLGQAAIALLWRRPSSALEQFHLSVDPGPRQIQTVAHVPGREYLGGGRNVGCLTGPRLPKDEWDAMIKDARGLLDMAGRMIECWTSAAAYESASPILRNMAQALLFFSEACRDENDLMAIVKFTAVLEALAQGKSAGITKLAKARLGIKDGQKIVGDMNLDEVVEWIYSKGRSRTLHGTNPEILHDWSDARAVAESLTRHCLVACMEWLGENPTATEPKKLLLAG